MALALARLTDVPVFITTRDRVSDLRLLVEWLERAGHQRITLLDNASTWPPLLDYLAHTPHGVVRLAENLGSQALWKAELVPDEPFVLTDPDVLPTPDCPLTVVTHLYDLLERHCAQKVGLGLYLDDVPAGLPSLEWERSLVSPQREIEPGVFESLVDTTFALYAASASSSLYALRTGTPYQARHLPWYRHDLDDEHAYYLANAIRGEGGTTTWEAP